MLLTRTAEGIRMLFFAHHIFLVVVMHRHEYFPQERITVQPLGTDQKTCSRF